MASPSYTMVLNDARLKDRVKNPNSIVNLNGLGILEIMSSPSTMYKWMIQQSHKMSKNMLFLQDKGKLPKEDLANVYLFPNKQSFRNHL
jgi:hypothetical protein